MFLRWCQVHPAPWQQKACERTSLTLREGRGWSPSLAGGSLPLDHQIPATLFTGGYNLPTADSHLRFHSGMLGTFSEKVFPSRHCC